MSSTAHPRLRGRPSAAPSGTNSSWRPASRSRRARSSGRTRTTNSSRRRPRPRLPATTTAETAAAKLAKLYKNLRTPTVSIDLALPWITGSPYALYAHVRAITNKGPTSWSAPYGFNTRWSSVPKDLKSPHPGLVRWSPVDGATAYQVWIFGAKTTFLTTTNVADARDLYTFHRTNPFFTGSIQFRVRAQRALYGEVVSGLPATTWGPWSPVYTDVQPPLSLGVLGDVAAVSDVTSNASAGSAHALTPGFAFSGDSGGPMDFNGGTPAELFRVYVATDEDCVNIVYRGAVVGSPAYAPRTTGPLQLPGDTDLLAFARGNTIDHGVEGETLMLDGTESADERAGSQDHREHHNRLDRRCPRRDDCSQGRPARHRLAGGRVLLDRRSGRHRAQADDQASGSGRTDSDPVSRDRAAAGRLPVRPRDALRQGDPAGRHRVEPSLCKWALPQGPADLGRAHGAVVLRHAARCLAVRPRRPGVRDPVEQDRRSVAPARLPGDRSDVVAAPARPRQLVLPRPRLQPLASSSAPRWRGRRRRR